MIQKLNLSILPELLTICKLNSRHKIPDWALTGSFFAITKTADELSIVCSQEFVPSTIEQEPNWRCLKVAGPLDFALTGILANLAGILAEANISIFALSTFDTDYLLVKAELLSAAVQTLRQAGHVVQSDDL